MLESPQGDISKFHFFLPPSQAPSGTGSDAGRGMEMKDAAPRLWSIHLAEPPKEAGGYTVTGPQPGFGGE